MILHLFVCPVGMAIPLLLEAEPPQRQTPPHPEARRALEGIWTQTGSDIIPPGTDI